MSINAKVNGQTYEGIESVLVGGKTITLEEISEGGGGLELCGTKTYGGPTQNFISVVFGIKNTEETAYVPRYTNGIIVLRSSVNDDTVNAFRHAVIYHKGDDAYIYAVGYREGNGFQSSVRTQYSISSVETIGTTYFQLCVANAPIYIYEEELSEDILNILMARE